MKRKNKKSWKHIGNALHKAHIHNQNYIILTQILQELKTMNQSNIFGPFKKQ